MTEERDDKIGTSKIYLSRILGGPAKHEKTTNNTGFIKTVIEANIANWNEYHNTKVLSALRSSLITIDYTRNILEEGRMASELNAPGAGLVDWIVENSGEERDMSYLS